MLLKAKRKEIEDPIASNQIKSNANVINDIPG